MARGANNKARGVANEQRILSLLSEQPMTLHELADAMGHSVASMYLYRTRLMAQPKRIHVCAYIPNGHKPSPVYAAGGRPDVEFVGGRKPRQPEDRKTKQRRRLREVLEGQALTADQVGLKMHLSTSRARIYISELRALGQAYIARWQHPGKQGDHAPVYALGNKPDAPKPRQSRAQRYKQEVGTPERHDRLKSRRRLHYAIAKARQEPASWLTALGV